MTGSPDGAMTISPALVSMAPPPIQLECPLPLPKE